MPCTCPEATGLAGTPAETQHRSVSVCVGGGSWGVTSAMPTPAQGLELRGHGREAPWGPAPSAHGFCRLELLLVKW